MEEETQPIQEKISFEEWINKYYTAGGTARQYILEFKRFEQMFPNQQELNQDIIDSYVSYARGNKSINGNSVKRNPRYMGFIKALTDYHNEVNDTKFIVRKDRSRHIKQIRSVKSMKKDVFEEKLEYIKKDSYLAWLMAKIYFSTGLRASELLNMDISSHHSKWGWNLETRHFYGIGKGNKEFKVHFNKEVALLFSDWLNRCKNPEKPFTFYKSGGVPYKNQHFKLYRIYKKYGFTPHQIRHSLGYYLRTEKEWDIEQIRAKLRHENIGTTQIYVKSTEDEIEALEDEDDL